MFEHDQDTRENESGLDMSEWYEYERNLLNQIGEVTDGMVAEGKLWHERMIFDSLTNAIRGDTKNTAADGLCTTTGKGT